MRHFQLEAGQSARVVVLGRWAAPALSVIGPDGAPLEAGLVLRAAVPASSAPGGTGRYVLADVTAAMSGSYAFGARILPDCPQEAVDMRIDRLETVSTSFTDCNGASRPLPPPATVLGLRPGQDPGQDVFVTLPFRSTGPANLCLAGGVADAGPSVIWSVWFNARARQTIRAELSASEDLRLALTGAAAGSPQVIAVPEDDSQVATPSIPADGIYSASITSPAQALTAGPVAYDLSVKVVQ